MTTRWEDYERRVEQSYREIAPHWRLDEPGPDALRTLRAAARGAMRRRAGVRRRWAVLRPLVGVAAAFLLIGVLAQRGAVSQPSWETDNLQAWTVAMDESGERVAALLTNRGERVSIEPEDGADVYLESLDESWGTFEGMFGA